MCGIALIAGPGAESRTDELDRMLATLEHRGERTGRLTGPGFAAAVRRLPITDPEGSEQPMEVDDAVVLFNGEIYNYRELREQFEADHENSGGFRTGGDTEVLLRAWLARGMECLPDLRGQFAFAIIRGNKIALARDPLGIKPLYYAVGDGLLYVASEIKALVFLGTEIRACEPGVVLEFDLEFDSTGEFARRESRYAFETVGHGKHGGSEKPHANGPEVVVASLRDVLERAVASRVATNLPVAVVYSGGIDSTIALHLALRHHDNVTAFTVGAEDSEDFQISRRFCEEQGVRQVLIPIHARELGAKAVRETIRVSELTEYGDIINAAISMILFRKVWEHGIKIALTGDGSDELFAGYDMYKSNAGAGGSPNGDGRLFHHKLGNLHRTELQRVDRTAMAATVEARVPFLDQDVVAAALAMPDEFKRRDGWEKWCLREAFRHELPDYIIGRRKNPLSHSSGLHEIVRARKHMFAAAYRREGYERHGPLRRDFSHVLRLMNYDLDRALDPDTRERDYSRSYLFGEALKARLRRWI